MAHIGKLQPLLKKAKREGWHQWIRSEADEDAVLHGCHFDIKRAQHFEEFCRDFIKLQKGEFDGQPFLFHEWQRNDLFYPLFGWVNPEGFRRFRQGYVEMPKKNTKSTSLSAISLYMLVADGEPAAECFAAATEREEAKNVWSPAASMVESSPELEQILRVNRATSTIWRDHKSFLRAWSADVSGKDGQDIHFLSCDELYAWKGKARKVFDKIKYGGSARRQPLCPFIITTAGNDRHSLCWEQHEFAEKVIEGRAFDHTTFALMFRADPVKAREDPGYWKTEECWREANPCFEITLRKSVFESDLAKVEGNPAEESAFKQYRCNIWTGATEKWIPFEVWDKNKGALEATDPEFEERLLGKQCWSGLDLGDVDDLSALIHVFRGDDGGYDVLCRFWCPEVGIRERAQRHGVRYDLWAQQGLIIPTEGETIDHETILKTILEDREKFEIQEIAYDRYGAEWIKNRMMDAYIEVLDHGQGMASMKEPAKYVYKCLKDGIVRHGDQKVLTWMAGNVVIEKNAAGDYKPSKAESAEKVDGMIGFTMALGRAWTSEGSGSQYSKGGINKSLREEHENEKAGAKQ